MCPARRTIRRRPNATEGWCAISQRSFEGPGVEALVAAARAQLDERFAGAGGIAAAALTDGGTVLTGVVFDPDWGGGGLCAETGPLLEAHRRNEKIIAIACVGRLSADDPSVILSPCGICKERLFAWGGAVRIAVPMPEDPARPMERTLDELQPFYWVRAYERRDARQT